jgi:hypothetical protein
MPCASGVLRGNAREEFSAERETPVQASSDITISFFKFKLLQIKINI